MRKLRIFEHISLDGVIAPATGNSEYDNGGWTAPFRTAAGAETVAKLSGPKFDLLLGRRTYDLWAGYWPKMKGGPFADPINAATKFVATHRPQSLEWGPARDLGSDIVAGVRGVKAQSGPDLVLWGSSTLTSVLLQQELVDEVVLIVYPILLGGGVRFFSDSAGARQLSRVSAESMSNGVQVNVYQPVSTADQSKTL